MEGGWDYLFIVNDEHWIPGDRKLKAFKEGVKLFERDSSLAVFTDIWTITETSLAFM